MTGGIGELAGIFGALSDETRLRIVKLLEKGELCVCDIVAALCMSQPKVSFHLGVLKEAGFIKDRKEGRWTHYSLEGSDMFKRFLLVSALERAGGPWIAKDRKKLKGFLRYKEGKCA